MMKVDEALKQINSLKLFTAQLPTVERIGKRLNVFYIESMWTGAALGLNCEQPNATVEINFDRLGSSNDRYDTRHVWEEFYKVVSVLEELRKTPVKERFPEKKYRLRWIDDCGGRANYLDLAGDWELYDNKPDARIFTEKELQQLKINNPRFAPAIEAMKEPVEDD